MVWLIGRELTFSSSVQGRVDCMFQGSALWDWMDIQDEDHVLQQFSRTKIPWKKPKPNQKQNPNKKTQTNKK